MTVPRLIKPPRAEQRPTSRSVHGVTLQDEFQWLKAANWQDAIRDPSVLPKDIADYLRAENRYTAQWFRPHQALVKTLVTEMKGRISKDDSSVPVPDGAYDYYTRYRSRDQYPLVCRRPRNGGKEQVMLNGNAIAKGMDYFSFGGWDHSPEHNLLAWSYDDNGNEYHIIRIRDLATGQDLPDVIPENDGSIVWSSDQSAIFYVKVDDNHRPLTIMRHVLGTDPKTDTVVFHEKDPTFFFGISAANAGNVAFIAGMESDMSEFWMLDLASPDAKPRLIAERQKDLKYWVEYHPDIDGVPTLFIRTNADGAEDFCVMTAPAATPSREHWKPLIPHCPGTLIISIHVFADWLVRLERENALNRIVIRELATGAEHVIAFDEPAYALFIEEGYEFRTDELRFIYSSMTTPQETWDYDMRTRRRILRKTEIVPSGHDPLDYRTERVFALSHDGEQIPVSLVYKDGTKLDGTAPLFLYGYGSYGSSMPARFATNRLSLIDRGFVFAVAHVRGGMEKGYRWYRNGKLEHKENTFRDFISCAEHLVASGYGAKGRVIAHGASAGGMLMGAVANMRPDLFAGVIAGVPFVDVINTMMDESLPLTPPEWPEWGDPIRDPQAFRRMYGYCPYSNVAAKDYPAIFALGGVTDPRVTYWEPAKWVARLRRLSTSKEPLLLKTDMTAGHGGAAGRFDRLHEIAETFAFALVIAGVETV